MKKYFVVLLFVISGGFVFAQSEKGMVLSDKNTVIVINEPKNEGRAHFKGGDAEFRKLIINNLDKTIFQQKEPKCQLLFSVTDKGYMSDIIPLCGDEDLGQKVLDVILKINPKWTPAKLDGKNIKSRMRLPIFAE